MQELLGRITALDPDAGAALQAIAYFDALLETQASLGATVRAAAVLAGCPAGVLTRGRQGAIRFAPDGRQLGDGPACGVRHPFSDGQGEAWIERGSDIERAGQLADTDQLIAERFSRTAQVILARVERRTTHLDPAAVETLLDPDVQEEHRGQAARRLGLDPVARYAVVISEVAVPGSALSAPYEGWFLSLVRDGQVLETAGRSAVSPPVVLADLAEMGALAIDAIRLTTPQREPGPTSVALSEVLGLVALAAGAGTPAAAREVATLNETLHSFPWAHSTMHAVLATQSVRLAAAELPIHHSTMQQRVAQLNRHLGWDIATPAGRTRLTIALALRAFREAAN